ncbi:hypothetical protein PJN22_29465, partial [Mycobacterium kansasii]
GKETMKKTVVALPYIDSFSSYLDNICLLRHYGKKRGEEIIDLKERLASQKQWMDHALILVDQALACRPLPWVYVL